MATSTKTPPEVSTVPSVYQDANNHTCICLRLGEETVDFIPLMGAECEVFHMDRSKFLSAYKKLAEYPVKRAAQLYLHDSALKTTSDEAREHLEGIVADPAFNYDVSLFKPLPKEKKLTDAVTQAADAATKKTVKAAPAKKPVAKAAPAKKPVAKAAPAKKSAEKAAPAKKSAKKAASEPDATTYKIGDASSVKRGFIAEFVEAATEMKKFQRDEMVKKFARKVDADRALRYFYYCTAQGIFVAA